MILLVLRRPAVRLRAVRGPAITAILLSPVPALLVLRLGLVRRSGVAAMLAVLLLLVLCRRRWVLIIPALGMVMRRRLMRLLMRRIAIARLLPTTIV